MEKPMKYTSGLTETGRLRHAAKPSNIYRALCGASLCLSINDVDDDCLWDVTCLRCRRIARATSRREGIPW
jgi:hypothetical protein